MPIADVRIMPTIYVRAALTANVCTLPATYVRAALSADVRVMMIADARTLPTTYVRVTLSTDVRVMMIADVHTFPTTCVCAALSADVRPLRVRTYAQCLVRTYARQNKADGAKLRRPQKLYFYCLRSNAVDVAGEHSGIAHVLEA